GVASELADELGDVPGEAATALLRRLAEHPLARVRGRAARRLARRGDAELPRVAAVWATLDAGAAPDDIDRYDRDDFLVALGLDKGTAEVDWSARIAALGMSPVALAALPAPIDNLTDADGDVRSRALRAIDEAPRREYLLATALAAEVQDELHRRWPQIDDYHGWYRWREASGMPGWLRSARDDVPRVVRSHASELSDQRLTPALRDILARGAEWFAATLPAPTIELGDDERAAADAEERAVIARRGDRPAASLDADPVLPAVDDLFAEPPPDAQGPVLGTRDEAAAERIAPDQAGAIAPAGAVAGSELIAIRDGKVRLLRYRLDDREVVDFVALLESRVRHLRVDAIELVVRDAAGAAVDHQRRIYERHLRPAAWIDHQWRVDDEVMARAHAVELRGTWREAFRARVAHAAWPAFPVPRSLAVRQPVPLAVTRDPGAPAVGAAMTLTVRADDHVDLRFLIELTSQRRTAAATPIELAVAVRNKHGSVLDRRAVSVTLPADGTGALVEVDLRIAVNQLSRAHLIDVAVQGARTVVETIASYPLNGAT
ncbi:MAG TPA: hypothetical protein VK601_02515, partial [Kofleriaceae bacterium]|nr:hypothetical protein [Kofleriaceae bacterium]